MQLADIFGGDVDFHRDLRKGDPSPWCTSSYHLGGRPVRAGRCWLPNSRTGKTYRAVHFGNGYYAPDGNNLRKAFLRAPLEFSRVSSGFGMRVHPIAKAWRAHKGIDYAAPIGTRVRAVGDASSSTPGREGGYGNVVILRHNGQYSTVYAHLSRIAVQRGARVAQNDTIGFVGQTGWATGRTCTTSSASPAKRATRSRSPCLQRCRFRAARACRLSALTPRRSSRASTCSPTATWRC